MNRLMFLPVLLGGLLALASREGAAQVAPTIEVVVPFDSAGRLTVITPTLVSRLGLTAPVWPVSGSFREARLFRPEVEGSAPLGGETGGGATGAHVLVVQRLDGSVARFALDQTAVRTLLSSVNRAMVAQGSSGTRMLGPGSGVEVSQPAGNAFVRNQTFLGLVAYGPATAALLSKTSSEVASAGYFLAAGTSFFIAANTARHRVVTRAQASRAAHGGSRGALTGLGVAAILDADGGPAWGAPILVGAIGGSILGFQQARGLSDGEAASAGLFADLSALATIGVGGAAGAFVGREYQEEVWPGRPEYGTRTRTDNALRSGGKSAIGAAIGANLLGYALGPRYARRAAYNVTSGDANVVFTSGVLGGVTASSLVPEKGPAQAKYAVATAGMLLGALAADRGMVRLKDRTSADGTLVQLGALAGALMGGGLGALAETEVQGALAMAGLGGTLGMLAADNIIKPARDAGPLRGIMQSSSRALDQRVSVSLGPISSVRITF